MTCTDSLNNKSIFHYNVIHYLTEHELLCIFSPDTVFHLQMFLVFCPNILMFLAFVLWGVSEGQCFTTDCASMHYNTSVKYLFLSTAILLYFCFFVCFRISV